MTRLGPAMAIRDFRLWWLASVGVWMSLQMIDVAIGWQVYAQHHSTLDLGLVGLVEFAPMVLLALPAGQLADRLPRRLIFASSLALGAVIGAGLAVLSGLHDTALIPYLALALGAGATMALMSPAAAAMPPTLVPSELLGNAMTLGSITSRLAAILGPAIGGVVFAASAALAYVLAAAICVGAALCVLAMRPRPAAAAAADDGSGSPGIEAVLEGLQFLRHAPVLLGAWLLDLVGVLFGGAIALLPVYASSILHVGPTGLGILRAAPAVGAVLAAVALTRWPQSRRAGPTLLGVVALFGVSIVVFAISRSYPLSLLALGASGFVDLFSMNIRATLSAFATPEHLRGRVGAVEMVFISASNELGAFESGVAASLIGTTPAVAGGGALTILVALSWRWLFPTLARVDRLADLDANGPALASPAGAAQ